MMMVEASHVSKAYPLSGGGWHRLRRLLRPHAPAAGPVHWALRDVSFRASAGSTLGVIGDNGAGKSTLLGIVTGIVAPTEGSVRVSGRVTALMELGAGFVPEFTGRQNVQMAGGLLGLSRAEIADAFPRIEAFAELGAFIDQPVRTYSSGMYVRLAFSLATSVDPDVLIIDEVLAVGDQYFQKKCVNRIAEFRRGGKKALIFCSHQLYFVRELCDQVLWLREGLVEALGPTAEIADRYQNYLRSRLAREALPQPSELTPGCARILSVRLTDESGAPRRQFSTGESVWVRVRFEVGAPETPVHVGVQIIRNDQVEVLGIGTHFSSVMPLLDGIRGAVALRLKQLPLLAGFYQVSVYLLDEHGLHLYDIRHEAAEFAVASTRRESGLLLPDYEWVTPDLDEP